MVVNYDPAAPWLQALSLQCVARSPSMLMSTGLVEPVERKQGAKHMPCCRQRTGLKASCPSCLADSDVARCLRKTLL